MLNDYKIAVSGKSGCGNTTVSSYLAEELKIKLVNYTFRDLAVEKRLSFEEVCLRAETDPSWDYLVDERQVTLANQQSSVLASRLAIWIWKQAQLRVYLHASIEVRAARIQQREGGDLRSIIEKTIIRDEHDHARYLRLYGIDNNDISCADIVIDVSLAPPCEIVGKILEKVALLSSSNKFEIDSYYDSKEN